MRKLTVLFGLLFVLASCSEENAEPQCPECEQCDKTQCPPQKECPALECDGNKCPACPACEQKECPPVQCNGKECPVCDTCEKCEECDTSKLDSEIDKLKGDLQAQVEATESCTGDLDTCSKDLATNKLRNIKSGSRLKVYNYVSEDGAQWPSMRVFDTKKNVVCTVRDFSNFSKYGCTNQTYCVTTNKYDTDKSYVDSSIYNQYYLNNLSIQICDDIYESTIYSANIELYFGTYLNDAIREYSIKAPESRFYIDSSCSTNLTDNYLIDETCKYNSSSVLYEMKYRTEQKQNSCMDGTSYQFSSNLESYYYTLYQPKNSSYATIYYRNSSGKCVDYGYKNVILLKKIKEISNEELVNTAKANREKYCKQVCAAINKEAVDEDWAKIDLVVAE